MSTFVPGTGETNPQRIIQSLQQVALVADTATTNIAAMQAAWTAYTPTITAGSGSFTTVSGNGRYLKIGKTVIIKIRVIITTNGTAASYVSATVPFTAIAGSGGQLLQGRENGGINNKMLSGIIGDGVNTVIITTYDSVYPGANGAVLEVNGIYESA